MVALLAASPSTVFWPADVVTTAPVNVAVPLVLGATTPFGTVLLGVDEKAVPLSVVDPGAKNWVVELPRLLLDLLKTVITGLTVEPPTAAVSGGAMAVISSA